MPLNNSTSPIPSLKEPSEEGASNRCSFAAAALEFTSDLVVELDTAGNILFLNTTSHVLLELDSGAADGKPFAVFLHEDDRSQFEAAFSHTHSVSQRDRHCPDVSLIEARVVSVLGRVTRASLQMRMLNAADNGSTVLLIGRDISELSRVREQLLQSQKLETIGMLASGISHDFNNMLAAILGYTELMLEDRTASDPDYRALTYIQNSTERAAALVRQILLFTRRSGQEFKPVSVAALVQETLQILQRTLPRTVRIAIYIDTTEDQVMGDSGRLLQALMNLCLNARDAMPNGGELRIEVERTPLIEPQNPPTDEIEGPRAIPNASEYLRIRIQDTGMGMPPDVLHNIWAPFFTTKPQGSGTGLGLSVVKSIVEMHKGLIQVESQIGRGTIFFLYLPAASGNQLVEEQKRAEPPGGAETLLVVDDEPVLLQLLSDILQPKGYHVLAAASGEEALDYVRAVGDKIDLVISDNMMPGMTGRELAKRILMLDPMKKILVCSGFSPTRDAEAAEMNYVTSYVQKPYQRRDLLARVREALDDH
jgi:two-component system cell cycle sensor histidine kinase/response regulator CckA